MTPRTVKAYDAEGESRGAPCDVLKVGHHGTEFNAQEFLDAVARTISIISSGKNNPYQHPSPELLERLEASGARVLRTDRDGAVHIVTDGDRLARDFLLRGMRGISDCGYFKTRGSAKSEPEQSAIAKNRRLPATHDFSYIAWTKMFRCHYLRV